MSDELVTVATAQGHLHADLIRGQLESAGITVFLRYEAIGQVLPLTMNGLGQVEVQVPAEFADEARAILEAEPAADADAGEPPPAEA